jgi:predicted Zn-dependent peptidase
MYESESDLGITHFLEHIAIRNVNKLYSGRLYAELDKRGVEFNASTYSEMVQFYVSGAMDKFSFGAEMLSKLFSPIVLDRAEIDAERKRIKAEIRESDDKSSLLTFTNGIVHEGTSLAGSITGTLSGVDKFGASRLESYRRSVFTAENVFFYITGNFTDGDVDYLSSLIEDIDVPHSDKINSNVAPLSKNHFKRPDEAFVKNDDYTMVRFTFDLDMSRLSVPVVDLIYDMLLTGYDSRFFIEMSEVRGLFYDLTGAVERYKNVGELYFSYEVKRGELEGAVEMTVKILNEFKKTLHAPERLMKSGYVDNAYLLYDDARELNFTFAYDNHIMDLGYASIDERRAAYDKISAEDIRRAAEIIFTKENLTLTLKGDKKKTDTDALVRIVSEL